MYNLILVDVDYDRTIIHRMNVITGDYLPPVYLRDDLPYQCNALIKLLERDMPDKIIFDKAGKGHIFYYYFMERVRIHKEIDIDSFGLITYI
jgi:hypothetical protein